MQLFGICGGSGADSIPDARQSRLRRVRDRRREAPPVHLAYEYGIDLVDAGHFSTENVVVPVLRGWIAGRFPEVEVRVAESYCQPEKFYVG